MIEAVGRYQLHERIGQGAMANVYRAYDPTIDRVLAIKVLKEEFRANPEHAARFLREAKAAGALSHPNIVTIFDVGEADGYAYIAMELLDGAPLDEVTAGERQPVEMVLAIAIQLADALNYAHAAGIVHRDIKPSNIMLGLDRKSIKILDFGIASLTESDPVGNDQASLKTHVGQILGTPRYMSPEQALGLPSDGRSDLFSAGAMLYELLTGRPAFSAPTAVSLALQITQHDPLRIADVVPDCPPGLAFIVEKKLLAKKPERRFLDGATLAKELRRERAAYRSSMADERGRQRYLPLQARLTLAMVATTALVLFVSISAVLDRQYRAMERMMISSGTSIAAFVASNAALPAVENAGRLTEEQDWLPVQAFISAASEDPLIAQMTMVDSQGIIRGATDARLIGRRYSAPRGEQPVVSHTGVDVTLAKASAIGPAFRFVRPILYAGRPFGSIDVTVRKSELIGASELARTSMIGLAIAIILVVMGVSSTIALRLAAPIRRLKLALADAASGKLDFRISHRRKDEFGELFNSFNIFAATVQERLERNSSDENEVSQSLEATRVAAPVTPIRRSA